MTYQFPLYCFCFAVACIFVNIYAPGCTKGHPPNLRSPFSSLTGSLRYMALKEKIMVNPSIQLSKFLLYTITSRLFCQVFSSSADLISAHFPDIILSKHLHHPINCSQYPAGDNAVQDHRACNGKYLAAHTKNFSFCLCQVNPKRFFYFPVEIRQEFFFPYYEASPGIHSPIISVRYLLFSPISIRPPSNTRTLSISRLITSGRYSVKA